MGNRPKTEPVRRGNRRWRTCVDVYLCVCVYVCLWSRSPASPPPSAEPAQTTDTRRPERRRAAWQALARQSKARHETGGGRRRAGRPIFDNLDFMAWRSRAEQGSANSMTCPSLEARACRVGPSGRTTIDSGYILEANAESDPRVAANPRAQQGGRRRQSHKSRSLRQTRLCQMPSNTTQGSYRRCPKHA